jgi:hypothetical protein
MINTITFKTVSPLYEAEKSGEMPFTFRKYDDNDERFHILTAWTPVKVLFIKIVNPVTGESFEREITNVSYLRYHIQDVTRDDYGVNTDFHWLIIHFAGFEDEQT